MGEVRVAFEGLNALPVLAAPDADLAILIA